MDKLLLETKPNKRGRAKDLALDLAMIMSHIIRPWAKACALIAAAWEVPEAMHTRNGTFSIQHNSEL